MLLTRKDFREGVLERDGKRCVLCNSNAIQAAHHIMERRLFPNGGYYLDNGATVCATCHWACERTKITPDEVREAAGIDKVVLPPHLYQDQEYTKWGDPVLSSGMRLKGELFDDESVQKVIIDYLHLYVDKVKYPRTYHLPWSQNITDDDRVIDYMLPLMNAEMVVVTEKMDGQNVTLYSDDMHTRSLDSRSHPSTSWVKNFWSQMAHDIPRGWRVCGENLYAKHSIHYDSLPSYFMGFSIWNDKNECLGWDETLEWFDLLGITPVDTLYKGSFDVDMIQWIWKDCGWESEGYVVRDAAKFHYKEFPYKVGKYVRKNWAAGVQHWQYGQRMEINTLFEDRDDGV